MKELSDKISVRLDDDLRKILPIMSDNISEFVRQTLRKECGLSHNGKNHIESLTPGDKWLKVVGSKRLMAGEILKRIKPHKLFIEVFGGGANLILQKEYNPKVLEVYNDRNAELANLFFVVQNHFEEFYSKLSWSVWSRSIWKTYKKIDSNSLDPVSRAVRYYYLIKNSFAGRQDFSAFAVNYDLRHGKKIISLKTLYKVHNRFRHVLIENTSFEKLIPRFDRSGAFFYLDPPYTVTINADKGIYQWIMSWKDHRYLQEILQETKANWLLSYDDHPEIRDLYADFIIEEINCPYSAGSYHQKQTKITELLIRNYDLKETGNLDSFIN